MTKNTSNVVADPLAHMVERLRTSEVLMDPYPHYFLEQIFPDDYYRELLRNLPGSTVYQNLFEITDLKLDHFRYRDQKDIGTGWTDLLPGAPKVFWDTFNAWFLGPEMARAALHTFAEPMRVRFGDEAAWPEVSVEVQLIRHHAGFFLQPHSDANSKLVVLLLYLAPDASTSHLGTSIYRPKDPTFSCPKSAHHPFEDFIRVKTAPYLPNSMLAFFRSDQSFHGVEPLSEEDTTTCNRDVIQYVIYDKQARQAQILARRAREAAAREAAR